MIKTGFVILNYNSWEMTKHLAEKVATYSDINYIVIVDNVSTDDSFKNLKKIKNEKIYLVKSEENRGYSYGNNFGAHILNEFNVDIIFFSNPDIEIEQSNLKKIINGFTNLDYAILSGIEYDINKKMAEPVFWKINTYIDDLLDCFFFARLLRREKNEKELNTKVELQEVEMIKGSFFAIRSKEFFEIDGFDDHVFLFCEERIISKKIIQTGKKMGFVTNAKYYHNHTASINKTYKKVSNQIELLFSSRLYYQIKYNEISRFKIIILKGSMSISILEYKILDYINLIKCKFKG